MAQATLTISSRNYGSWSLRGWLLCKLAGIEFEPVMVDNDDPSVRAELLLLALSSLLLRGGERVPASDRLVQHSLGSLRPVRALEGGREPREVDETRRAIGELGSSLQCSRGFTWAADFEEGRAEPPPDFVPIRELLRSLREERDRFVVAAQREEGRDARVVQRLGFARRMGLLRGGLQDREAGLLALLRAVRVTIQRLDSRHELEGVGAVGGRGTAWRCIDQTDDSRA